MELKQLNKIIIIFILIFNLNVFSQMKFTDIENKKFFINTKTGKKNLIKILDDYNFTLYYIVDRRNFETHKDLGINSNANIIFFSKKNNKGILTNIKQVIQHSKKNIYNITLYTGANNNYMLVPSMIIVDKNFNYEYLMKYSYIQLPFDKKTYKSSIYIQDIKNYCSFIQIELKGNAIYEDIDNIIKYASEITKNNYENKCDPLINDIDLNDFFPKKIIQ